MITLKAGLQGIGEGITDGVGGQVAGMDMVDSTHHLPHSFLPPLLKKKPQFSPPVNVSRSKMNHDW